MVENRKISVRQFMILVILFSIGSAILVVPSAIASFAKQDAWIAAIIGVGLGLLFVCLYNAVGSIFPGMTLVELNEELLGKWLGKTVSLLLVSSLFAGGPATVIFYVGNFMTTQMMPQTPLAAFHILFTLIVVLGVRLGLEVLARSAEILFPWFLLLFVSLVILITPQMNLENLQPVFASGAKSIVPAVFSFISIAYLPDVILLMIFPAFVNQPSQARKVFLIGSFLGGLVMIVMIFLSIAVLGPDLTALSSYPSYALAKKINIGNFLQRIEAIMAIMWFFSLYFRITLYFFAIILAIAQICNMKDYRPLVLPVGVLGVVLSLVIYPNVVYAQTWDIKTWIPYTLVIGLFYPLLLFVVASVRKVNGRMGK